MDSRHLHTNLQGSSRKIGRTDRRSRTPHRKNLVTIERTWDTNLIERSARRRRKRSWWSNLCHTCTDHTCDRQLLRKVPFNSVQTSYDGHSDRADCGDPMSVNDVSVPCSSNHASNLTSYISPFSKSPVMRSGVICSTDALSFTLRIINLSMYRFCLKTN